MGARSKEETKQKHEVIKAYYAEGHTTRETAEHFGMNRDYVKRICRGIRPFNQYMDGSFDREANARRYIEERTPWFEYAGNFTGIDGYVDLRCKKCEAVIRKSFVSVKQGKAECGNCLKLRREEREAEKERERQAKEIEAKRMRVINAKCSQISLKFCKECGEAFVGRGIFCSGLCSRRWNDRKKSDRRVRRINSSKKDGISLRELYERDGGICYLCGKVCDWEDCETREDGTFIAKDYYPSVDHVIPLSKGGSHTWNNVKLAHRICNSKKSDKVRPVIGF